MLNRRDAIKVAAAALIPLLGEIEPKGEVKLIPMRISVMGHAPNDGPFESGYTSWQGFYPSPAQAIAQAERNYPKAESIVVESQTHHITKIFLPDQNEIHIYDKAKQSWTDFTC